MATLLTSRILSAQAPDAHNWQEGTILNLQSKHRKLLDPHTAQVDVEIQTASNVIYKLTLLPGTHKVDLIPGTGIVASEQRRSRTQIDVIAGSIVKFAVSGQHGWLIDAQGIERKMLVKSERLAQSAASKQ